MSISKSKKISVKHLTESATTRVPIAIGMSGAGIRDMTIIRYIKILENQKTLHTKLKGGKHP